MQTFNRVDEGKWALKVKVISLPWPKVIYMWKFKQAYLRNHWAILKNFFMLAFRYAEMKICWHDANNMTKMPPMPIYGKNPSKIFISGTSGLILTKTWYLALGFLSIIVCSIDGPGLTLAYFMARSNLAMLYLNWENCYKVI